MGATMNTNGEDVTVNLNAAEQRFEAQIAGQTALVAFSKSGHDIVFTHTEVPDALQGRGIGNKLAHAALEYAREQQLTVVPLCPFVAAYIRKHPEYQSLVRPT